MTNPKNPQLTDSQSQALVVVSPEQVALEVQRIKPMFSADCNKEQLATLAQMAIAYGLDPVAGELTLYQGRAYVTIDGRLRLAHLNPNFEGFAVDRPATPQEYQLMRMEPEKNFLWYVELKRKDWANPVRAWGRVRLTEPPTPPPGQRTPYNPSKWESSPIARAEPHLLAQKRAQQRALRLAFPMPIPGAAESEEMVIAPPLMPEAVNGGITVGERINKAQNKLIHVLLRQFKVDEAGYREVLRNRYGIEHTNELMEHEAEELIQALEDSGDNFLEHWRQIEKAEYYGPDEGWETLPAVEDTKGPEDVFSPEAKPTAEAPEAAAEPEAPVEPQPIDPIRKDAMKRCRELYETAKTLGISVPEKPQTSWSTDQIERWNSQVGDKIAQLKSGRTRRE